MAARPHGQAITTRPHRTRILIPTERVRMVRLNRRRTRRTAGRRDRQQRRIRHPLRTTRSRRITLRTILRQRRRVLIARVAVVRPRIRGIAVGDRTHRHRHRRAPSPIRRGHNQLDHTRTRPTSLRTRIELARSQVIRTTIQRGRDRARATARPRPIRRTLPTDTPHARRVAILPLKRIRRRAPRPRTRRRHKLRSHKRRNIRRPRHDRNRRIRRTTARRAHHPRLTRGR